MPNKGIKTRGKTHPTVEQPTIFLQARNIHKQYEQNVILKDITLEVHEKEILVLLGPSGCGKSTLLNIFNGSLKPTSGDLVIRGERVIGKNPHSVTVFQRTSCFPWLTVEENIQFSLSHGFWKLGDKDEIREKAANALKRVGLADFGNHYPHEISGGMQQRAALARTLVADAPLVLMDEPFVGLDEQTKELMHMLILDLWAENKKTMLVITHDLDEAIFIGDRIAVLSARPAQVKDIIKVDLPRPRKPEMKFWPEFIRMGKFLSFLTEREVIKAAQIRVADLNPNALNIGVFTWIGIAPFYIAQELGLFEKHDVDVKLLHLERNDDRVAFLLRGEIDLVDTTFDQYLRDLIQEPRLKIGAFLNRSMGGDALLVKEEIKTMEDLRGKTIAIEKGWVNDFFLRYLLDKHHINPDEIRMVDAKESDVGGLILQNAIDGTVIWEPWLTNIRHLSPTHILTSTAQEPILIDALVGRQEVLMKRHNDILRLIAALFEANNYIREHQPRSAEIVSTYLGLSVQETEEQLSKIEFFAHKENHDYIDKKQDQEPLITTIAQKLESVLEKETELHYKKSEGDFFYTPLLFE